MAATPDQLGVGHVLDGSRKESDLSFGPLRQLGPGFLGYPTQVRCVLIPTEPFAAASEQDDFGMNFDRL